MKGIEMAVGKGSFTAGDGAPRGDKHLVGGKAQGPSATGNYSDAGPMAVVGSDADAEAKGVYGDPPNATRMPRVENIAREALDASPNGLSGDDNVHGAFIDGGSVKAFGTGYKSDAVSQVASTPGAPGFPGLPDEPASQGKDVTASKAVTAQSSSSNNPATQGSPGFPGLP
jgi:hypothetical protein